MRFRDKVWRILFGRPTDFPQPIPVEKVIPEKPAHPLCEDLLNGYTNRWTRSDLRRCYDDRVIDMFFQNRREILRGLLVNGTPDEQRRAKEVLAEIVKWEER